MANIVQVARNLAQHVPGHGLPTDPVDPWRVQARLLAPSSVIPPTLRVSVGPIHTGVPVVHLAGPELLDGAIERLTHPTDDPEPSASDKIAEMFALITAFTEQYLEERAFFFDVSGSLMSSAALLLEMLGRVKEHLGDGDRKRVGRLHRELRAINRTLGPDLRRILMADDAQMRADQLAHRAACVNAPPDAGEAEHKDGAAPSNIDDRLKRLERRSRCVGVSSVLHLFMQQVAAAEKAEMAAQQLLRGLPHISDWGFLQAP